MFVEEKLSRILVLWSKALFDYLALLCGVYMTHFSIPTKLW